MRTPERYASLESEANALAAGGCSSRQQVQRSVSTSVLEVQVRADLDPPYSKVRDSLTPLPPTPPPRPEDIYAEICEPPCNSDIPRRRASRSTQQAHKPLPLEKTGTRDKDRGYVRLASHSEISDISGSTEDEEGIYNTVC